MKRGRPWLLSEVWPLFFSLVKMRPLMEKTDLWRMKEYVMFIWSKGY